MDCLGAFMNKILLGLVCLFGVVGYICYDRYVLQPNELVHASEQMLGHVAIKEKWLNARKLISETSHGHNTLTKEIASVDEDDSMINVVGKISYESDSQSLCKWVDFNFDPESKANYEINSEQDCEVQ